MLFFEKTDEKTKSKKIHKCLTSASAFNLETLEIRRLCDAFGFIPQLRGLN